MSLSLLHTHDPPMSTLTYYISDSHVAINNRLAPDIKQTFSFKEIHGGFELDLSNDKSPQHALVPHVRPLMMCRIQTTGDCRK